jgi:hypothetical protein
LAARLGAVLPISAILANELGLPERCWFKFLTTLANTVGPVVMLIQVRAGSRTRYGRQYSAGRRRTELRTVTRRS